MIGDDVVTLEIGMAADYTDEKGNEFANAGTKTPNSVSFVSNPNGNYKAPELSEISFVIEKASLTFAETNSNLLKNGIYQGTQIPNVGVTTNENGDQTEPSTLLGTKIEKKDGGTCTAVFESDAVANAGHYRKVRSYSESKNYKATDFAIEFDVKPAEAISATDEISLVAGSV